jgi:caffeoyl-CoA O-methyltransferase
MDALLPESPALASVRIRSTAGGVAAMHADTVRFLQVLATALPARRTFEIGAGYGLSALAVVLAGGADATIFTVERDAARAAVAREHFAQAGLGTRANVMVGEAARLVHKVAGPFDLIVQDGDAVGRLPLLDRLVALLRPGGVLVSNHIGPGSLDDTASDRERLAADARLRTAFLPIGDGLAVSVRLECTHDR